jgi:hypothetical protein
MAGTTPCQGCTLAACSAKVQYSQVDT